MFRFPGQIPLAILLGASVFAGCGATKSRVATEQLLVSDAVDDAVASIDFRNLSGRKIFFDSKYIRNVKTAGFVNADYIISSLRQQMIAADCRLVENHEEADIIAEARVGTLGSDGSEVMFGLPASNSLSAAANLVPSAPLIPTIPEISFARREGQVGAAKIAVFAYERETGRPIWQSGIARSRSTAQDFWLFGAGPFQNGTIYEETRFAGEKLRIPVLSHNDSRPLPSVVTYDDQHVFPDPAAKKPAVVQTSAQQDVPGESSHSEEAKPIRLWGAGGKVATPLEEELEQVIGEEP